MNSHWPFKIDFILAEWHFMSDVYTFVVNEHIEFVWLLTCGFKYIIFSFIMTKVVGMPYVCKATSFGFKLSFVFSFFSFLFLTKLFWLIQTLSETPFNWGCAWYHYRKMYYILIFKDWEWILKENLFACLFSTLLCNRFWKHIV